MRFVVYGAGAVGGVLGGRLFQHGHDVVLIARGAQLDAIRRSGLRVESPWRRKRLRIPVVGTPDEAGIGPGDVVVLAMKTPDTEAAVVALAAAAPADTPVVCAQNGVANERITSRSFTDVYAMSVVCPCAYLVPGVVVAYSSPVTGVLDLGRYPEGVDDTASAVAAAFEASRFSSMARPDIMRWKYAKLLSNLGNSIEAVCGPAAKHGRLGELVQEEGEACVRAAGIDVPSHAEFLARQRGFIRQHKVRGQGRAGGSTWQTLARGVGTIETDFLNGEIVRMGREHGVPTPANAAVQRFANELARERRPPASMTEDEVLAAVESSEV